MTNRYGLTRNIDEHTKQIVRKRDGFGCVHCGKGIYTYEHFNPTFNEARTHDHRGIALLCGRCQLLTTKGMLSKETIQKDVNDPFCKRQGYSNEFFDLAFPVLVSFGNFKYYASKDKAEHVILRVNNETTLGCSQDPAGGPTQLSAVFRDQNNQVCLEIVKNEWRASTQNWDITQTAKKIHIYEAERQIGIELEASPPHQISFNSFATYFNGNRLFLDKQRIVISRAGGNQMQILTPDIVRRSAPINISL